MWIPQLENEHAIILVVEHGLISSFVGALRIEPRPIHPQIIEVPLREVSDPRSRITCSAAAATTTTSSRGHCCPRTSTEPSSTPTDSSSSSPTAAGRILGESGPAATGKTATASRAAQAQDREERGSPAAKAEAFALGQGSGELGQSNGVGSAKIQLLPVRFLTMFPSSSLFLLIELHN